MTLTEGEARMLFDSQPLDELVKKAGKRRGNRISFHAPSFIKYGVGFFSNKPLDYPAISITGEACALDCEHCGRRLLSGMISAQTPEKLVEVGKKIESEGARGCLISGGADSRGSVPLADFTGAIKQIKRETKLTLAVHTGLIDEETARLLGDAGIDIALIDIIGDSETLERVYHLKRSPKDFLASMKNLNDAGVRIAPHVVVGLNYGRITGEFHALNMAREAKPDALVLVGLMPMEGTRMESENPPSVEDFSKIIAVARIMMPDTPIILGCARDRKTKRELDVMAVQAGVSAIAHPSETAIKKAEELGLEIDFSPTCCAELALMTE